MFCQAGFDQWLTTIMHHLSPLSKPQATVLALWSFGMVLARSCALSAVSSLLAEGMQRNEQTVRQQLREWYYDAPRKRGAKRQALRVETCFAPLLGWVVSWWQGTQLALALDATTLGQRFVVLAVSVVYRGCAIPVAWVILPAGAKHAWRREWLRLLRRLRQRMPQGWTVIVLADRGLYAPWLFRRITRLGWHPFLRINTGGSFRPTGATCWRPLTSLCPGPGRVGAARAWPLPATRWPARCWRAGKRGTRTLAAPDGSGRRRPVMRAGMACGPGLNRALRSPSVPAGSGTARACDPDRAARCGWRWRSRRCGCSASAERGGDDSRQHAARRDGLCPERPRTRRATRLRLVSVFRQGWVALLVALLRQEL